MLELSNYTIELGEDSNLTITKSIYDVIEPDKRKSSFTKTITIPSSKQNDKVFADYFDVNFHLETNEQFAPFFNASKKAPCFIHTDTDNQMSGYAQLTDIVIENDKVEYKLTIYGEVSDIFVDLADRKLSDLDLSEYNHLYNVASIKSSWDNDVYINGSLIDSEIGVGYVYPQVDYGDNHDRWNLFGLQSTDTWNPTHFKPWVYVKTIWDKIFSSLGYRYYSDFINTDLFKKLIFQGDVNGLTYTNDEIEDKTTAVYNTGTQTITFLSNPTNQQVYDDLYIEFDAEDIDFEDKWDTTTNSMTIIESGNYNIGANLNIRYTNNTTDTIEFVSAKLTIVLIKSDGAQFYANVNVPPFGGTYTPTQGIDFNVNFTTKIFLNAGDDFRVCIRSFECSVYLNGSGIITNYLNAFPMVVLPDSTLALSPDAHLVVGSTVDISNMLTPDMTQKDFIMGIAKMFNLYIEPYYANPLDANSGEYVTYLIEPRDSYYTSDVLDWTSKLDNDRQFTIQPLALSKYKYYNFTYIEDNDFLNTLYKGNTGRIYGDYIHTIDNDFSRDTKKIDIPFSPAIIGEFNNKGRSIPIIKNTDGSPRLDGKPKILFYQGNKATDSKWVLWDGSNVGTIETQSTCPFAGQLDDDLLPTTDLNFKIPSIVYYKSNNQGEIVLTDGTLFNKYYYRQIKEINDVNSKMVECYMRLYAEDIHNLSFRPLYFIRDAYYRLYEVVDHNYTDTTLCRFLKLTDVTGVSGAVWKTRGGRGVYGQLDDKLPTKASPTDGTTTGGGFGTPTGSPNGGVVVDGDVSEDRQTQGLLGTNILQAGRSNGVIIKDNTIDFGYNYIEIASGSTVLDGSEGSPLYILADTTDGNALLYMPDYTINDGKIYFTKKTIAANQLQIYDHEDNLIETCSSVDETHQFLLTTTGVIIL